MTPFYARVTIRPIRSPLGMGAGSLLTIPIRNTSSPLASPTDIHGAMQALGNRPPRTECRFKARRGG